ncbi:amino acid ABC transporter substrate-binding protein [Shuttleworthella satelles]|uniref:amino acid ABC transporter substrate-binding protein n=1 Tax=Shuttleworthella satelles TaxID=177972 RepID=UPI0028D45498|nr:amino acid ABC transporter substrate-binding protein [Shuttleworthia satelles]
MKKIMAFGLIAVMVLAVTACGTKSGDQKNANSGDGSKAESKTAKKGDVKNTDQNLIVGFDQNFPPFGYLDSNGNFTGFDLELAQEAANRMKVELVLQPIDWETKDLELSAGTIDCIWNGFSVNGREKNYTFSDSYMNNAQVFVVRKNSGIEDEQGLAGKVVDVQKESSAETALNSKEEETLKNSFAQLNQVADYNTAMMDLESGAVDAVAMDKFVALDQMKNKPDKFQILNEQISSEQYAVAFLKGNTQLRDQVNSVLHEMDTDGTFAKISQKYFGENVSILSQKTNAGQD